MVRRPFATVALLSCVLAVAATAVCVRGQFCRDEFFRYRWDAAARTFHEMRIVSWNGSLLIHSELASATPVENTAVVRRKAGPTGTRWTHTADFIRGGPDHLPVFWADRYRAGPLVGINPRGLADCWTVECRPDVVAVASALLPAAWVGAWGKRWLGRRAGGRRGFAVGPVGDAA